MSIGRFSNSTQNTCPTLIPASQGSPHAAVNAIPITRTNMQSVVEAGTAHMAGDVKIVSTIASVVLGAVQLPLALIQGNSLATTGDRINNSKRAGFVSILKEPVKWVNDKAFGIHPAIGKYSLLLSSGAFTYRSASQWLDSDKYSMQGKIEGLKALFGAASVSGLLMYGTDETLNTYDSKLSLALSSFVLLKSSCAKAVKVCLGKGGLAKAAEAVMFAGAAAFCGYWSYALGE